MWGGYTMIHGRKCIKVHYLYGGIYYDSQVQIYECALFVWGWGYTMIHRCKCIKVHYLYGGIYYDPRCKCIKVHY